MQSDKIVGKQIWLTFFHILVCIKYCSTFSKARKHFFSKQNKTLCLTRACPFHSHKIFEIFEMLFYFHQILKNPFSFQIKKLFSDSAERVPPHSLRHRSNHSFNNEGGWEEAMRSKVRRSNFGFFVCLPPTKGTIRTKEKTEWFHFWNYDKSAAGRGGWEPGRAFILIVYFNVCICTFVFVSV